MNYRNYYNPNATEEHKKTNEELAEENRRLRIWAWVGVGAAIFAWVGCIYCYHESQECKALIANANDRIKNLASIDVDHRIVENAVNRAAKEASDKAVYAAAQNALGTLKAEIKERVKSAVDQSMSKVSDAVAVKMAKEVADISKDDIIEEVVKSTTEKLTERLEEDIGDEMTKVGEIYKNIVDALT